jgi:hypothetical protein
LRGSLTLTITANLGGNLNPRASTMTVKLMPIEEPVVKPVGVDSFGSHLMIFGRCGRFKLFPRRVKSTGSESFFVQTKNPFIRKTNGIAQALIDLYTAWDVAEPGKGYDTKAAEWKAKLDEIATASANESK